MYYILTQNNSEALGEYKGHWYAQAVSIKTVDMNALVKHMASHNSAFSAGTIRGVISDMVSCIRELVLEGNSVKIDDLAIFSGAIENVKGGAASAEEFNVSKNIAGIKVNALGTGNFAKTRLNADYSLEYAPTYTDPRTGSATGTPGGSGSGNTSGSDGGDVLDPLG